MPDASVASIRPLLVVMNDQYIFKIGGIAIDGTPCSTIERFDIQANRWETINYIIKEDERVIQRGGFSFFPAMTGIQVTFN